MRVTPAPRNAGYEAPIFPAPPPRRKRRADRADHELTGPKLLRKGAGFWPPPIGDVAQCLASTSTRIRRVCERVRDTTWRPSEAGADEETRAEERRPKRTKASEDVDEQSKTMEASLKIPY